MAEYNIKKRKFERYLDANEKSSVRNEVPKDDLKEELARKKLEVAQYEAERITKIDLPIKIIEEEKTSNLQKLIINIGWIALLIFTNPSLEMHQNKLQEVVFTSILHESGFNKTEKYNWLNILASPGANNMIPLMISRKNYLLFSITVYKWDGESRDVGIGLLGNVFLFKEINDYIDSLL